MFRFSCCGAGTAADTEYTTLIISANIELHRLETQKKVFVVKMFSFILFGFFYFHENEFLGIVFFPLKCFLRKNFLFLFLWFF